MLDGLFKKLPANAKPLFHSDQGWQYQHSEYQRLLSEHNIVQSMSRKGNCMDNGAMENFFGRLKVEMFYGEKFESVKAFIDELKRYIDYYNNERMSILQVLCKYKIVQKNLFKWTELNSVRFYVIRKISTCQ